MVAGGVVAAFGLGLLVALPLVRRGSGHASVVAPEAPVTAINQAVAPANNSPEFAADPTNSRFVVLASRTDAPDFNCGLQISGDGGASWIPARPVPTLPPGAEKCYNPEVAFDRRGVLYFLFVGLAGKGNRPMGAFLTSTADRARTFTTPRLVLGPLNFAVRMAIDPDLGGHGRIHLAWLHATSDPGLGAFGPPPNPILTAYSDDGGRRFTSPIQVSDSGRQRVVAPALALGPAHRVYIGYYDLGRDAVDYEGLEGPTWDGMWSIVLATSVDGGAHFGAGMVIDDSIVPPGRVMLIFTMPPPSLVADAARVCAAWDDARFGDPDALLRCSHDGGRSWDPVRRLNDDRRGNGRDQELPRLALSAGGRIDAVFLDRRDDTFNQNYQVMYTYSTDGGRHFAPNVRLTTEPSSVTVGAQYVGAAAAGLVEHGSRLALLSLRSRAVAAWPDARNATVLQQTEQDILATSVRLPGPRWWGPWVWVGAALVVAGLLLGWRGVRGRPTTPAGKAAHGFGADGRGRRYSMAAATAVVAVAAIVVAYRLVAAGRTNGAPLPVRPPVIDVTIRDHRYDYRGPIKSGRVVFHVYNATGTEHEFGLYPLPESYPPIDQQLHGSVRRPAPTPLAIFSPSEPGRSQLGAVDLKAYQRYAILDLLRAPDDLIYALKGLDSEFRAR